MDTWVPAATFHSSVRSVAEAASLAHRFFDSQSMQMASCLLSPSGASSQWCCLLNATMARLFVSPTYVIACQRITCVRTYARHYGSAFHGCGFAFHHCVLTLHDLRAKVVRLGLVHKRKDVEQFNFGDGVQLVRAEGTDDVTVLKQAKMRNCPSVTSSTQ